MRRTAVLKTRTTAVEIVSRSEREKKSDYVRIKSTTIRRFRFALAFSPRNTKAKISFEFAKENFARGRNRRVIYIIFIRLTMLLYHILNT